MESTIFTLETGANTYFIDYDEQLTDVKPYAVFTNEKFRGRFKTYGEALEFIFEKQGSITFYSKKGMEQMMELASR